MASLGLAETSALLLATLSPDAAARTAAEAALSAAGAAGAPGGGGGGGDTTASSPPPPSPEETARHAAALLTLGAAATPPPGTDSSPAAAAAVRQAAVIRLKNLLRGLARRSALASSAASSAATAASAAGGGAVAAAAAAAATPADTAALPTLRAATAAIREALPPALVATAGSPRLGVQLAEAVKVVIATDFPARYPALLPAIVEGLSAAPGGAAAGGGGEGGASGVRALAPTWAALTTLRALTKVYEFASLDAARLNVVACPAHAGLAYPRQPLDVAVAATFPALLDLAGRLEAELTASPGSEDLHELHKLALKCFWSAIQYAVPPALVADGGRLGQGWLDLLLHSLRRQLPPPPVEDAADVGGGGVVDPPSWKSRKWLLHILLRLERRYGDPSRTPDDQPAARQMAQLFRGQYAAAATAAVRDMLLASVASGGSGAAADGMLVAPRPTAALSPRVVSLALAYVEAAVGVAAMWAELRPSVAQLVDTVVFPLLCFSDADAVTLEADPLEYVRQQDELRSEDRYSPRLAASALLHVLASMRVKAVVLPFLARLLGQVLVPAAAAAPGSPAAASLNRLKDGALLALGSVKNRLIHAEATAGSLLVAVHEHVLPVLTPGSGAPPFLIARAAWLVGQFASPEWKAFTEAYGVAAVSGLLGSLDHPSVAVRATAAAALLPYASVEAPAVVARLEAAVPSIIERLIVLTDSFSGAGSDAAVVLETMEAYMARFSDQVAPLVPALTQRLVAAFLRSAPSGGADGSAGVTPGPIGGIHPDDDDDDDDDELSAVALALQALTAINAGLAALASSDHLSDADKVAGFAAAETALLPVLDGMFDPARREMFEESLDVLSQLLYHSGSLGVAPSPPMWTLFPRLAVGLCDGWTANYAHHAVAPLDNWVTFDWAGLVAPGRPFTPALAALASAGVPGGASVAAANLPTSGRYLEVAVGLVVDLWSGADRDEEDAAAACKIAQSLILHGKAAGDGALDAAATGVLLPAVAARLPPVLADLPAATGGGSGGGDDSDDDDGSEDTRKLAASLFSIVWALLWYNAPLTLGALGGDAAFARLLQSYATLAGPTGAGVLRVHDKKLAVVGLGAALAATGGAGAHDQDVVRLGLVLLQALATQRSTAADDAAKGGSPFLSAAKAFSGSAGGGAGANAGDTGDDDEEVSDLADDEDATDGMQEGVLAALVAEMGGNPAAVRGGGADAAAALLEQFWGADGSDEDEGDFDSPLDAVDETAAFGAAVVAVAARGQPTWWNDLSGEERAAVEALGAAGGGGDCGVMTDAHTVLFVLQRG
ncbi:hypothetical protein MMPV_006787 [Pyropia vietnamensis]